MALQVMLRVGTSSAFDVSLTSSGVSLLRYPMAAPDVTQEVLMNLGDGNSLSVPSWANVTESIDIFIQEASAAAVRDKVRAIEQNLDLARQGTTGVIGDKLYLRARFDQDSEWWRSQIIAAKLELPQVTSQIWKNHTEATLIITRRYYWETEDARSIPMTSGPTTAHNTTVLIYNDDDLNGSAQNYFDIDAGQVSGSIPAPLKLTVTNVSGGSRQAAAFYFGNYVFANPGSIDPIFTASGAAGSTPTWLGTLSNDIMYWGLSNGNLTDSFKGQFGRVLAIFNDVPAQSTLIRASLQLRFPSPVIDLALGEHVLANANRVLDLGAIPFPPGNIRSGMGAHLHLTIQGNAENGDTVGIDWVQIMPSGAGKYRVIKAISPSWSMASNDKLVDDGPNDAPYELVSGSVVPIYRPFFAPLHVWPNRQQRIRMIVQGNTTMELGQPWWVSASYHPRRLTV